MACRDNTMNMVSSQGFTVTPEEQKKIFTLKGMKLLIYNYLTHKLY